MHKCFVDPLFITVLNISLLFHISIMEDDTRGADFVRILRRISLNTSKLVEDKFFFVQQSELLLAYEGYGARALWPHGQQTANPPHHYVCNRYSQVVKYLL